MALFKPRQRYCLDKKIEMLEMLRGHVRWANQQYNGISTKHAWYHGRPVAHKLIGVWAENNPTRWVMWDGASPQLKNWNRMMPPIRSIQIDMGLTDEETNSIFRNPRIQTKEDLTKQIGKVLKTLRGKADGTGQLG